LSAVEAIEREYGVQFGVQADRRRYRLLQALNVARRCLSQDDVDPAELTALICTLTPIQRLVLRAAISAPGLPARLRRGIIYLVDRSLRQYPPWKPRRLEGRYANILEFFDAAQAVGDPLR
jgi:hypothetical protein